MTSIALVSTGHRREEYSEATLVVDALDELSTETIRDLMGRPRHLETPA